MSVAASRPMQGLGAPDAFCDPAALRGWLAPALGPSLAGIQPLYLRYKRDRSALIGVALTWRCGARTLGAIYLGEGTAVEDAATKAATRRLLEPAAGPAVARLDSPDALFLAFPNDRALRGLTAIADPRRLKNRLHALGAFHAEGPRVSGSKSRVEVLRWKPGRRAVLCATLEISGGGQPASRQTWILRAYPPAEFQLQRARWESLAKLDGMRTPRLLAADPERAWLGIEALDGEPLGAELTPAMIEAMEEPLRRLHAAPPGSLPRLGDAQVLRAAEATVEDLVALEPALSRRARALGARLDDWSHRLRPAPMRTIHGDLKLDQWWLERGSPVLLDWDELAAGDPHMDLASLTADVAVVAGEESGTALARSVLGEEFDSARFSWHRALAELRRARAGLQTARGDWRSQARAAVERAATALDRVSPGRLRRAPKVRAGTLARLLDPAGRTELAGGADALELTAVWNGRDGAIARLEPGTATGGTDGCAPLWLHLAEETSRHPFPADPDLPHLARLVASRRFEPLGHRLFRRAALLDRELGEVLHLRPLRTAAWRHEKRRAVACALRRSGVTAPVPLRSEHDLGGWFEPRLAGEALAPHAPSATWSALGRALSLAHATAPPVGLAPRSAHAAFDSVEAPLALLLAHAVEPGGWIARRLSRERPAFTEVFGNALVHGDLHPAQILVGPDIALLDWDAAHPGEAEEDLGNLLAHLEWAADGAAAAAWPPLSAAYRASGRSIRASRVATHARLSLLRILAIHAWRDAGRDRSLDRARWSAWLEELTWLD